MSTDLMTFNVRCAKSHYELKIPSSVDVAEFIDELKNKLSANITDEIMLLCPTPDGKMMEIKSDDDLNFLKKTKLCYNAVSKEIYCSVELVATIISKPLPDDPKLQMMLLSNKVDQLTSQFDELSQSISTKLKENSSYILENIRPIMSDLLQNKETSTNTISCDEPNIPDVLHSEPKNNQKPNKVKKEKVQTAPGTSESNNNSSKLPENVNQQKPPAVNYKSKDIEELLQMLGNEGFTNTIQNIIVLKRFENDYEKALSYLKKGV